MKYQFNEKEHIHTLDDKPLMGTSTVVGIIAKPLTYWASGLAVGKLGCENEIELQKMIDTQENLKCTRFINQHTT